MDDNKHEIMRKIVALNIAYAEMHEALLECNRQEDPNYLDENPNSFYDEYIAKARRYNNIRDNYDRQYKILENLIKNL
jgi:hypothetical protein